MTSFRRITIYINEADKWKHRPLHLEILKMLKSNNLSGATVLHAVAGFTYRGNIETSTLVDIGGKLPLVIETIDKVEKIEKIIPIIKNMIGTRLMVSEDVNVINYDE